MSNTKLFGYAIGNVPMRLYGQKIKVAVPIDIIGILEHFEHYPTNATRTGMFKYHLWAFLRKLVYRFQLRQRFQRNPW